MIRLTILAVVAQLTSGVGSPPASSTSMSPQLEERDDSCATTIDATLINGDQSANERLRLWDARGSFGLSVVHANQRTPTIGFARLLMGRAMVGVNLEVNQSGLHFTNSDTRNLNLLRDVTSFAVEIFNPSRPQAPGRRVATIRALNLPHAVSLVQQCAERRDTQRQQRLRDRLPTDWHRQRQGCPALSMGDEK